ncbi:MAG: leucine-rich repeat domain-containing protein, partial [Candidatus Hodarchaeota archaeon]
SNLVLKTMIEVLENNFDENSIILKQEILQRFSRIFSVVPDEAKFFKDLFVYLANIGENMDININYVYKYKFTEFWPYPFYGVHYGPKILAVKNGHAIALSLPSKNAIPKSIGLLKNLKYLRLNYNSLKYLPRTIRNLENLRYLSLYHNNFEKIPNSIFFLKNLRILKLEENKLNSLPHWIGSLNRLRHLPLWNNNIKLIPKSLFELAKRKQAKKYIIKGVNEDEAPVLGLLELLSGFRLQKLEKDEDIYHSEKYDPLHFMNHYKINELGYLTHIYLYSREPYLGVFPPQICSLNYLEELHLSTQFIKFIPECIGNLTSLKVLNLMCNEIKSLPESMKKLRNLERVSFFDNPLKEIPDFLKSKRYL